MATTIKQQTVLDESLVPSSQRLRIGRCKFRLPSDIQSKEATLQVNSNQQFADLPTEEEVLDFLRSFASVINKCLTGKSSGVDSFRLSQAQMLWGFYHRINIEFAYLVWEDFVYQVEHNNQNRSNEMNYPRFTKVIIDYFMTRKPSISRRNRINWHYVRDDALFSTIKVVSRHQTTQQYDAILPIELTTDEIRNREAAPKLKASARKKKGDSASSTTPPTLTPTTTVVSAPRLSATAKGYGALTTAAALVTRSIRNSTILGIRMQYLPSTIWRKGDKDRAAAMIKAIDKMLKTRRIMRSLEKFIGGRLYEGDLRRN
nr:hypothetical protein [Tanacetum cinerariifolium]